MNYYTLGLFFMMVMFTVVFAVVISSLQAITSLKRRVEKLEKEIKENNMEGASF